MTDYRTGKWAADILAAQNPDGTWGARFHSMAQSTSAPLTTEQALRRLHALGFTQEDAPVRRCVDTMARCLRGERKIDAYWEKGIDWDMFEPLMLAAWIRRFDSEQPDALAFARRWARIAEAGFAVGEYDESAWNSAYEAEFNRKDRHPKPLGFIPLYHAMLLPGLLSPATERSMVRHILHTGMYYVHQSPPINPPAELSTKQASYWLAALEILTEYSCAKEELAFAAVWLHMNADTNGRWDFSPAAKDGIYFPLSDSWRTQTLRKADCTERIQQFLDKIT